MANLAKLNTGIRQYIPSKEALVRFAAWQPTYERELAREYLNNFKYPI